MSEQNYRFNQNNDMIDISSIDIKQPSSSKRSFKPLKAYGGNISRHLGIIIKIISFIVAFSLLIVSGIAALALYRFTYLKAVAVAVFILGVAISAISLFIFYGIGHVICQNNEILCKLNKDK